MKKTSNLKKLFEVAYYKPKREALPPPPPGVISSSTGSGREEIDC